MKKRTGREDDGGRRIRRVKGRKVGEGNGVNNKGKERREKGEK
jgi:hypothetical protein